MNTVELVNEYFQAAAKAARDLGLKPAQLRVLVIDDDPDFNTSVERSLQKYDVVVDIATDGKTGHWKSFLAPYDLILLDLKMTGMDGIEVLKKIKEDRPTARVVICTGFATPATIAAATQYGPIGVIEKKPEDMEQLLNVFNHYNLIRAEKT